ncbi:putative pumilio homolog 16 [Primulina huaijiensis]|uniref:putative pumilio homolog 16 n=1 Tax=Primulina huaijiensis TaxID=1492673 RepID=UPI003CC777CF
MDLAIDEVGCRSLNECISTISGKQKITLLESIAEDAVFLSNDRYRNYVVQQAMMYGHDNVAVKILFSLCGHFTQLSQEKWGSHVVEKCRQGNETLCLDLVKDLEPHLPELQRNAGGKQVVNIIISDLEIHFQRLAVNAN